MKRISKEPAEKRVYKEIMIKKDSCEFGDLVVDKIRYDIYIYRFKDNLETINKRL